MKKEMSIEEFFEDTFSEEFIEKASVEYMKSVADGKLFAMSMRARSSLSKSRKGIKHLNSAMQLWNES